MFGTILTAIMTYGPTVIQLAEKYGPGIVSAIETHGAEIVQAVKTDGPGLVEAIKPMVQASAQNGSLGTDLSGVIQGTTAILNSGSLQTLEGLAGMFMGIGASAASSAASGNAYNAGDPTLPDRDPAGSSKR